MQTSFAGLLLGLALGARHALEPDHVAAVSVLAAESPGVRRGALLGMFWGIGHTSALIAAALALAVLGAEVPPRIADVFALGVAITMILFGLRGLRRVGRHGLEPGPASARRAGGRGSWAGVARPLVLGTIHGLAGSGALTALIAATLTSWPSRLVFVALFGVGSTAGMALLSGLAGWPLARFGRRPAVAKAIGLATGALSAGLGVWWGWPLAASLLRAR